MSNKVCTCLSCYREFYEGFLAGNDTTGTVLDLQEALENPANYKCKTKHLNRVKFVSWCFYKCEERCFVLIKLEWKRFEIAVSFLWLGNENFEYFITNECLCICIAGNNELINHLLFDITVTSKIDGGYWRMQDVGLGDG